MRKSTSSNLEPDGVSNRGMFMNLRHLLFLAVAFTIARQVGAAPTASPEQTVAIWRGEWRDGKRERTVPVKIYFPQSDGAFPVVIFSHGLGGSREGYEYLGNYWAQHGYVAVHLQHIGSDDSILHGGAGLRGAMNLRTAQDRARDVSFALDQLELLNKTAGWPPAGKLDLARIGMAGHSFGANTTLLIAGLQLPGGVPPLGDRRIKCAVAMSSPPPLGRNYDTMFGAIKLPMLHMTGTKDSTMVDRPGSTPADRRIPFDHIQGADGYLVTFTGGDHMLFAGRRLGNRVVATDDRNHLLIEEATTAFWGAYLKGDAEALARLRNFATELRGNGVFEQKPVK